MLNTRWQQDSNGLQARQRVSETTGGPLGDQFRVTG